MSRASDELSASGRRMDDNDRRDDAMNPSTDRVGKKATGERGAGLRMSDKAHSLCDELFDAQQKSHLRVRLFLPCPSPSDRRTPT
jgi:hypothetical protein